MSGSPAEPLRHRAAELALELNEVLAMLRTGFDSSPYSYSRALAAHKLLLFELSGVSLGCLTVFHSSKVRLSTLEALVVGQFVNCVTPQIIVESVVLVLEAVVLVQVLKFSSLHGLFEHDLLEFVLLLDQIVYLFAVRSRQLFLALRAVKVVEDNSGAVVLFLDSLLQTAGVVDVPTFQMNAGLLAQS